MVKLITNNHYFQDGLLFLEHSINRDIMFGLKVCEGKVSAIRVSISTVSALAMLLLPSISLSAPDATVTSSCLVAPAALSELDVNAFLGAPEALLTSYPNGGLEMSGRVRALSGSNSATIDPLLNLASQSTAAQKAAIGAGLARAARACVATDPEYAQMIQEKVAGSNISELITAFLAASNDTQTAALVGGAAASAASPAGDVGGGGSTNGGSGGGGGDSSVATTVQSFSFNGGGRYFLSRTSSVSPN